MADFHYYELTITAKITVPASGGEPTAINTSGIPAATKAMLNSQLASFGAAVTLPALVIGAAVEVPAAPAP
jgi:hypothetical protein